MSSSYDPDQIERLRANRQVLAGNDVQPLGDPWERPSGPLGLTPLQLQYIGTVVVLAIIAAVLIPTVGVGIATVPLFLLGLFLLAGWLFF